MKIDVRKEISAEKEWRTLALAFYSLAHNDQSEWDNLPSNLKQSDIGQLCQKYIDTKDSKYIEEAGVALAGKHWHVALGRTF
ncbi:hypothetical protein [Agarivorans aestuarii]|uniref:hypothetical protein n=1 Tax=Agarivorans aestuarii TaxID=1563703 RepID=UPI001C81D0B9|nr:hypothetical protein [Agarivorans aestuarii]